MSGQQAPQAGDEEVLPLWPVLVLTEEELLVLTDGDLGVVPARIEMPTDPDGAELVRAVATRTLMARGLITPGSAGPRRDVAPWLGSAAAPQQAGEGVAWEATEPLGLSLTLRTMAPVVLALQRVLGPRSSEQQAGQAPPESTLAVRYLHLHAEVAVIEDVTPDGMHGLLTVFPDRYEEAVSDFIRPAEAVAGTGEARTLASGSVGSRDSVTELLESLGRPTVLVEAAVSRAADAVVPGVDPVRRMLALGPGGSFWSADSVTYHPADPAAMITQLVREAMPVAASAP